MTPDNEETVEKKEEKINIYKNLIRDLEKEILEQKKKESGLLPLMESLNSLPSHSIQVQLINNNSHSTVYPNAKCYLREKLGGGYCIVIPCDNRDD